MRLLTLINLFFACYVLIIAPKAFAVGSEGRGGGDSCEDRFKVVATDLEKWIKAGGGEGLDFSSLPFQLTFQNYTTGMLDKISRARITCVGPGDADFPVLVHGKPKECRSYIDEAGIPRIICDRNKFYLHVDNRENNPAQYRIVHHEYATLAGFEVANEDDSSYVISDQITDFLEDHVVKRLAVKSIDQILTLNTRMETLSAGIQVNIEQELAAYEYVLNLAGRKVSKIRVTSRNEYGRVYEIQFTTIGSRSRKCSLETSKITVGAFGNLKSEVNEFLRFNRIDSSALVDAVITSTRFSGAVGSVQLSFCSN